MTSHSHSHSHDSIDPATYADQLDLEAAVHTDLWRATLDWVAQSVADDPPARLIDLGAGSGVGTIGLARRFEAAEVIALDHSPELLDRVLARATELGLADRVHPLTADLDAGWPEAVRDVDLVWASMSLHHVAEPDRVLRGAHAATRPGGWLAVVELTESTRLFAADSELGRIEARAATATDARHRQAMPTHGSRWAPRIAAAGWEIAGERAFAVDTPAPAHPDFARYARHRLARIPDEVLAGLDAADRAALAELGQPGQLEDRSDLHLRGVRTMTLARRR